MARAGDILENPATGERPRFLQAAAETNGDGPPERLEPYASS